MRLLELWICVSGGGCDSAHSRLLTLGQLPRHGSGRCRGERRGGKGVREGSVVVCFSRIDRVAGTAESGVGGGGVQFQVTTGQGRQEVEIADVRQVQIRAKQAASQNTTSKESRMWQANWRVRVWQCLCNEPCVGVGQPARLPLSLVWAAVLSECARPCPRPRPPPKHGRSPGSIGL